MDLLPDDHLYGEFLPMNKFEIGALSRHYYNLFLRQNAISYDLRLHLAEIQRVHQYKVFLMLIFIILNIIIICCNLILNYLL
jgi:hypothetical protein